MNLNPFYLLLFHFFLQIYLLIILICTVRKTKEDRLVFLLYPSTYENTKLFITTYSKANDEIR